MSVRTLFSGANISADISTIIQVDNRELRPLYGIQFYLEVKNQAAFVATLDFQLRAPDRSTEVWTTLHIFSPTILATGRTLYAIAHNKITTNAPDVETVVDTLQWGIPTEFRMLVNVSAGSGDVHGVYDWLR